MIFNIKNVEIIQNVPKSYTKNFWVFLCQQQGRTENISLNINKTAFLLSENFSKRFVFNLQTLIFNCYGKEMD